LSKVEKVNWMDWDEVKRRDNVSRNVAELKGVFNPNFRPFSFELNKK